MRTGAALRPPARARVLDLCSAPGGKAVQLLEAVGEEGRLVAADRGEQKLALLRQNLERFGDNFDLVNLPENPEEIDLGERFSHVLVDAPCSNTGVLARRPDARWRLRQRDLEQLGDLQGRLLEAAVRHLAPGGRLLYATCSLEPEENEARTARLTRAHPGLKELESRLFLPHRSEGDGGFYSLLERVME
jgi:16S rRNA (cytosine967-C5)-methyltransferase